MNKIVATRVAGVILAIFFVLVALAPLLWFDPGSIKKGGSGWADLREWAKLTTDKENPQRREQLKAGFTLHTSHRGTAWYTAADADGTCWALPLEPLALLPSKAPDQSWCTTQ